MRIADKGFIPWLFWALFTWKGSIDRLPFLGAAVCYVVLDLFYSFGILLLYAYVIIPLPEGVAIGGPYFQELLVSGTIPLYVFLPLIVLRILLQVKRLRSMGFTPWIAVVINMAKEFNPGGEGLSSIVGLMMVCYYAILLFIPSQDTARPVNGGRRWPTDSEGKPRKLTGKDLGNWRVVEPAPRLDKERPAGQDEKEEENRKYGDKG